MISIIVAISCQSDLKDDNQMITVIFWKNLTGLCFHVDDFLQ